MFRSRFLAALPGIVMPEQQLHGRRRGGSLQVWLQEGICMRPDGVQLVVGIAPDHVEVHVGDDGCEIDGWGFHERERTSESTFLAVERRDDDGVDRAMCAEILAQRKQRRGPGGVVVGAVENLAAADADVIVVGGEDDDAR